MKKLEHTLDSREAAEMMGKEHKNLMRDINRYIKQINEANTEKFNQLNIAPVEFFKESTYKDAKGETRPCYLVTKKGCEFIAHKLTGTKGTIFTARYINRFHEMQDILSKQEAQPQLPWFIKEFRGEYIMLFRDFETLTGISLDYDKPFWKTHRSELELGIHHTWWAWHTVIDREEFYKEYGFDYGDGQTMEYLRMCGIKKVLKILENDRKMRLKQSVHDMIADGLKAIEPPRKEIAAKKPEQIQRGVGNTPPIQISIVVGGEQKAVVSSTEIAKGGVV